MLVANAEAMTLANKPRKQILAIWCSAVTSLPVGDLWPLAFNHLYGLIASAMGGRPVGEYTQLPRQYALQDIYVLSGGSEGNHLSWGELQALANIYAQISGEGDDPGKIASYLGLNKSILTAMIALES